MRWNLQKVQILGSGGFAFASKEECFANAMGQQIKLWIQDFPALRGKMLQGVIIRSTDNNGIYIVGCRLLQDSTEILNYVHSKMS